MLEMWLLTVLVDNPSLAAIARLDSPDAISSSTSCSRGVSSAKVGSGGVLRASARVAPGRVRRSPRRPPQR